MKTQAHSNQARIHPWKTGRLLCSAFAALAAIGLLLFLLAPSPARADDAAFVEPRFFGTGVDYTTSVALGDMDGDGDLDLVVGNGDVGMSEGKLNAIYMNDGAGSFDWAGASRDFGAGDEPTADVAVGDMDSDGDLDIVVLNRSKQSVVYLNDGTASFPVTRSFGTAADLSSVAVGDVNGDGALDIVVGNWLTSTIYVNDGTGNFDWVGAARPFGLPMSGTTDVAVGDMDGDGSLDIAVATYSQNRVYLNDGSGGFAWAGSNRTFGTGTDDTESLALGDVDGDGDIDIVVGNMYSGVVHENRVYRNDGAGNFDVLAGFGLVSWDRTASVALGDVDADGDLDIAVGNTGEDNALCLNNGIGSAFTCDAFGTGADNTLSVMLGDVDSDGDLDVAAGNMKGQNAVYINDGGGTFPSSSPYYRPWPGGLDLAVGDMDGDGTLDLVTPYAAYLNDGLGGFNWSGATRSFGFGPSTDVAVGDLDGDGDLDIAVAKEEQNLVHLNDGAANFAITRTFGTGGDVTASVALGDMDGDGDLDIVVANIQGMPHAVYLNDGAGNFDWPGAEQSFGGGWITQDIALGDLDGDGDLDIVTGNYNDLMVGEEIGQRNVVYLNDGTATFPITRTFGTGLDATRSVALGDMDGDGALDIVVGNYAWGQNAIYLNDGAGNFGWPGGTRSVGTGDHTQSIAVGDVDNDGDLDVLAGNLGFNAVHLNDGHASFGWLAPARQVGTSDSTFDVALGDTDGDGDLDLVIGNSGASMVYMNPGQAAGLANSPPYVYVGHPSGAHYADLYFTPQILEDPTIPLTYTLFDRELDPVGRVEAFYSLDGSGYWQPAVAASGTLTQHMSTGYVASTTVPVVIPDPGTVSSTLDFDSGDQAAHTLEIALTISHTTNSQLQVALYSPWPAPTGTTVLLFDGVGGSGDGLINLTLADRARRPITQTIGASSPVSGTYRPMEPLNHLQGVPLDLGFSLMITDTTGGGEGNLEWWTLRSVGADHVYTWDTLASGFFGRSDNVVLRFVAHPQPATGTSPGTYRYPNSASGSYQWAHAESTTFPFRVRGTQVRVLSGTVPASDALVYRIPAGQARGEPIVDGAGNPYRTDSLGYLQGRGTVNVGDTLVALLPISSTEAYTVYATNATPTVTGLDGHVVVSSGVQTLTVSSANPLLLFDLDVSLEWDARNDDVFMTQLEYDLQRTSSLLYDWTDGQAALGDVTIYHDRERWNDADVRIYATNRLRPNAAQGGISTDVISDTDVLTLTYGPGQVHIGATWNRYGEPTGSLGEDWPRTLAHELGHFALFLDDNYLGLDTQGLLIPVRGCSGAMSDPYRADHPYDEFHAATGWLPSCEQTLSHQTTGRADWETIEAFYPWLDGTHDNTGPSNLPLAVTQVSVVEPAAPVETLVDPTFYLVDSGGGQVQPGTGARAFLFHDDQVTNLGRPTLDRVVARGARPGDRLCVYELAAGRLGCEDPITASDEQLTLNDVSGWEPDLIISPITSRTIGITVTNVAGGLVVQGRLYPLSGLATDPITLTEITQGYAGILTATEPALAGYVHVWVDEVDPRREVVTDYALGGNPGTMRGTRLGFLRNRQAPAVSADGQVILFGDMDFAEGDFFTLQAATVINGVPDWMTTVGHAYRLSGSPNAPDLSGASISFAYLGSEVPSGQEQWIKVYYQAPMSDTWQVLPTQLDTYYNNASAPVPGEGLYVLMTSTEVPIYASGWNLIAYPIPETRPVITALQSISGTYAIVYGYEATDIADPWKIYAVGEPSWVNDLDDLEFGRGYWISATQPVTLHLRGAAYDAAGIGTSAMPMPPATYYGHVESGAGFIPAAGMTMTAWIDGHLCGQAVLTDVTGYGLAYAINVMADDSGAYAGCGGAGREIVFQVNGQVMGPVAAWSSDRVWELALRPHQRIYMPLVICAATSTSESRETDRR